MEVKIKIPNNACSLHTDGHKLPLVQLLKVGMYFDIEALKKKKKPNFHTELY